MKREKFQIPVVVDHNKRMRYETHNWIIKVLRAPIMLFLNILPARIGRAIFLAFSGENGDTRVVCQTVTTYKALEVMYTYPNRRARGETNLSDSFWESFLSNARAIRNRLLLVKGEVKEVIKKAGQRKNIVNLLSLGSGSARAIFEVAEMLNEQPRVRIKLIDMSRNAIEFSKELARKYNINHVEWHRDYAQNLERYCKNFHPDVVEMVGLLDYYPHEYAVDLVAKIYKVLSPGGWLVTCNIRRNFESPFVTKSINWPLIYRSPKELADILLKAGFPVEGLKLIYEPLVIHGLAIAQKIA